MRTPTIMMNLITLRIRYNRFPYSSSRVDSSSRGTGEAWCPLWLVTGIRVVT